MDQVRFVDYLTQLAIKYGTDKYGKHNYTQLYYDLFNDKREKVKKVLEIGTAEGAGIKMFRDFFPNATIYGAEISIQRVLMMSGEKRIQVYLCDQSSSESLDALIETIGKDIDIVIDDGSHKPEDQVFTANYLLSYLNPGVTYIIEDVSDASIVDKIPHARVERVGDRYDDQLVIING